MTISIEIRKEELFGRHGITIVFSPLMERDAQNETKAFKAAVSCARTLASWGKSNALQEKCIRYPIQQNKPP